MVNRDTSSNENLREPPIASALGGKATLQQAMPAGPRHRPAPGQEPRTGCSSVPRGVFLYPAQCYGKTAGSLFLQNGLLDFGFWIFGLLDFGFLGFLIFWILDFGDFGFADFWDFG